MKEAGMYFYTRLLSVAIITAVVFSLGVGTASALRSLEISGSQTLSLNGILTFTSSEGGTRVECPTTIIRVISRAWPKTAIVLIGDIIEVRTAAPGTANCRSSLGTLRGIHILGAGNGRDWRLFWLNFGGTLPRITDINEKINTIRAEFEIELLGAKRCLYVTERREEERMREEGELKATTQVTSETGVIGRTRLGGNNGRKTAESASLCPELGRLSGELTPLQTTTLRLI